jgi:hypothetical protein
LVFVDGYDETRILPKTGTTALIPYTGNIYKDLKLSEWPNAKTIAAIRTQTFVMLFHFLNMQLLKV